MSDIYNISFLETMILWWFIYRLNVIGVEFHIITCLLWSELICQYIYISNISFMVHSNMFTSEMCEFGVHSVIKKISDISS